MAIAEAAKESLWLTGWVFSKVDDSSNFYCLLDQNKIYNLIYYSITICTRSKSGFSTNYYSIVVFRYRPQGWLFLVIKA